MKTSQRFGKWWALPIFVFATCSFGRLQAATFTSTQSGSWGDASTWGGAGVPGAVDNVIISNGHTVTQDGNRTCADLTVNGTLDTMNDYLFFQGTTFANNGALICSVGGFGELRFLGINGAAGTTQNLAGIGTYGTNGRVDLHLIGDVTVVAASGATLNGVGFFTVDSTSVLSLPNTLVARNGTTINNIGLISGAGTLQTQGPVTINSVGSTTAPFEAVSGNTVGGGTYGKMTIDAGATFTQNGNLTTNGDFTVAAGGTLDMSDSYLFFQGTTFTNHGALISPVGGFGEVRFLGINGAAGTTQNLAGAGTYNTNGRVDIHLIGDVTVVAASGATLNGVGIFTIEGTSVLSLPNTLVAANGTTINNSGLISGAGTLQTQGPVTLNSDGSMTAPFEAVSGVTSGHGAFGQVTIDSGATLFLNATLTASGNVTVSGTLDMNNGYLEFQGPTLTNNGSVISSTGGYGIIDFNGVNGAGGTTQTVAGTGPYNLNGRNDMRLFNSVTVSPVSGTTLNGVAFVTINAGTTLDFTGSGSLILAGDVSNSGTVKLNGGGTACGDPTKILIRSSVMGVQHLWSGGGTFLMTDVDVQDQAGNAPITVTGGVNSGNNGANWTFATCGIPTPTPTPAATPSKLLNISTRLRVQAGDNVLIGGFIITGTAPKRVIVRALGPSLAGVPGALADPTLELHEPGDVVVTNDNWRTDQEAEIIATSIPPSNDLESAIVATLNPGTYTAIVRGKNGGTGVGLVEAYDLDQTANSTLANISTRGFVETLDNVMIGGLIIGPADGAGARIMVRALGPSLTASGVPNALQDPILELHDANGGVTTNDNWRQTQESEIQATGLAPTDDHESAILATLAPGNYTAVVSGVNNTTGNGLVEFYHLP